MSQNISISVDKIDWPHIMEILPDHLLLLDTQCKIRYVNRPSPGITFEQLIGTQLYTLAEPGREEEIKSLLEKVLATGQEDRYETVYVTPDSDKIYYESRVVPYKQEGIITGLLLIARDVTELKHAQQAVATGKVEYGRLQKQLLHSQKMDSLGRLTGGIAHDFNNILASVKGYTELARLLAVESGNQRQDEYLGDVLTSVKRATGLVEQMLSFVRGKESMEKVAVQLPEKINEAIIMLRPVLTASISLSTHYADELPDIELDVVQFNQVLMNLCINARDAMDGCGEIEISVQPYSGEIECSSCHKRDEGQWLQLTVKDNGTGIDAAVIDHIFDPFYSTKEVGKGSGMGLSVVHGIVHDHGGHIQLESSIGKGSAFHIFFPL